MNTRLLILLPMILLSVSCASITRGTTEHFVVRSEPDDARVKIKDYGSCRTPCGMEVKRKVTLLITIAKEGYESFSTSIKPAIDGAGGAGLAGNVIFGGLIGMGVDAASGALLSHQPNPLEVTLEKEIEKDVMEEPLQL